MVLSYLSPPFKLYVLEGAPVPPNMPPPLFRSHDECRHQGRSEGSDEDDDDALSIMSSWGMRITKGTLARPDLVPNDAQLLDAFCRRFKPGDDISAGARALCKHRARYVSSTEETTAAAECFWGNEILYGNSHQKNASARKILDRLLYHEGCAWINLYAAFGGRTCFEARGMSGHGARWILLGGDRWSFAGFVEPQQRETNNNSISVKGVRSKF